jgi:hypothetical protein
VIDLPAFDVPVYQCGAHTICTYSMKWDRLYYVKKHLEPRTVEDMTHLLEVSNIDGLITWSKTNSSKKVHSCRVGLCVGICCLIKQKTNDGKSEILNHIRMVRAKSQPNKRKCSFPVFLRIVMIVIYCNC